MTPPNIKTIIDDIGRTSEVINSSLWYVNPNNIRAALQSLAQNLIKEIEGRKKLPTQDQEYGLEYDDGWDASKDEEIEAIRRVFDL